MMELLIRARPIVLIFFLCALALTVIGSSLDLVILYMAGGLLSQITLLLILAPYCFGARSSRISIIKIMARLFFVALLLITCNLIFYIVAGFLL